MAALSLVFTCLRAACVPAGPAREPAAEQPPSPCRGGGGDRGGGVGPGAGGRGGLARLLCWRARLRFWGRCLLNLQRLKERILLKGDPILGGYLHKILEKVLLMNSLHVSTMFVNRNMSYLKIKMRLININTNLDYQ